MNETHVTIDEINGQPEAIEAVLEELAGNEDVATVVSNASTFCLVGCGTSYFLSLTGSALLNESAVSFAVPGSEVFIAQDQLPSVSVDVIIPISRSGESTETVRATEHLQGMYPDATVLGITCTAGSSIHELSDVPILSPAGAEEGVVMTKSYSSMLVALEYLALVAAGEDADATAWDSLPSDSERILEAADVVASELGSQTDIEKFVFLGSGEYYGLAMEAMLKLEEMTLGWTKAYHSLEFRHGPQSIADDNTLVTVFLPGRNTGMHANLVADITELGATTLVVGTESSLGDVTGDYKIEIPDRNPTSLSLSAPIFQLLGYYRAVESGLDPDEPKNLSQVVTF